MKKLIYGVATNSGGKYKATVNGTNTPAYSTWHGMLSRAYCPKLHARQPTYIGCSVANEWLEYQEFAEWFEGHEYSHHGYELDKDLLVTNNKLYSPETCCFVPQELNNLLTSCASARGDLPQGVYLRKHDNKFRARIRINGKNQHLGYYDTPQEAYQVYRIAKEANVKRMANHWRDRIASDVFDALMQWELGDAK